MSSDRGVSPGAWARVSRQRALVYGWFSALYAAEVPRATLASYMAGGAAPMLKGFSILGLESEAERLHAALEALRGVDYAHLELAADFAQMFLLDAKGGALPYASVYESEGARLYGPAEERMRAFLAGASLAIQDDFKEPADHLALYLAVMARLIEDNARTADSAAAARDQAAFLEDAVLSWLPAFNARSQQASPRFDFYPALAALLTAVVLQDASFVREVAAPLLPEDAL
ncbi:MAG: molecular chaperone TorD [Rhodospirillaceae bacterium]